MKLLNTFNMIVGLATLTVIGLSSCKKSGRILPDADVKQSLSLADQHVIAARTKKVLFIGIDGCVWKAFNATNAPNLKSLMEQSWVSTNALAEIPTWSSNGWSGLLTGVGVAKHKASSNSFTGADFTNFPSFFREIRLAQPALSTTSVVTWAPINTNIINSQDVTLQINSTSDNATERRIIQEITSNNRDVSYCHFDNVDHAGHASNFRPDNKLYTDSIKAADARVGRILTAVKGRSTYQNEDWLIVIATDHGGDLSHGGSSYTEQNAFIILNNSAIAPRLVNAIPVSSTQSSPHNINTLNFKINVSGQLPPLSTLNLSPSGSFTIEFKVKAASTSSDPVIIGNKNWVSGYNKGIIISNRNGMIRANFGDGRNRLDVDGVDLRDQLWHQVAVVVDRTSQQVRLYDGGQQVATGSIAAVGDLQSGIPFRIGQDGIGNYNPYFTGNIAEIRLFKSALQASAVSAYAFTSLNSSHPKISDLVLYTRGNDGSGIAYKGSLASPQITLTTKDGSALQWASITTPVFVRKSTDFQGAPYLYSVAPTILKFLGVPVPTRYDGTSLINFQ